MSNNMNKFNISRHRLARLINEFLDEMTAKYGLSNDADGISVAVVTEPHLADRILDREFPRVQFQRIVSRMFQSHICEMIYMVEVGKHHRINIYGDDGYMIGVTGVRRGNRYDFKIRTCYKERNHSNRKRTIESYTIKTTQHKVDYTFEE